MIVFSYLNQHLSYFLGGSPVCQMSSKDEPIRLSHIRYDQISLYQPQGDNPRLTP